MPFTVHIVSCRPRMPNVHALNGLWVCTEQGPGRQSLITERLQKVVCVCMGKCPIYETCMTSDAMSIYYV